jgi:sulfhydrogenase subunit gamma (sulfur reductase)
VSDGESIFLPEMARVVRASDPTPTDRFLEIGFENGRALDHRPGQFVEASLLGLGEAPISVCSPPAQRGSFELCIRDMGGLTARLQEVQEGDIVGIRGPYGNGFPMAMMMGRDCLVVAGGIGLAPLRSVISEIAAHREDYGRLILLYGARAPEELLFRDDLARWAEDERNEVLVTVDRAEDGWTGHVGVVTTLFPQIHIDPHNTTVTAVVGPPVMYRFVMAELRGMRLPLDRVFISLERRMKCGVGKCGNCQIDQAQVCVEGPVFTGAQIETFHETL